MGDLDHALNRRRAIYDVHFIGIDLCRHLGYLLLDCRGLPVAEVLPDQFFGFFLLDVANDGQVRIDRAEPIGIKPFDILQRDFFQ